jgi:hypothetical protein
VWGCILSILFWTCSLLLSCLLACSALKKIDSALTSVGLLEDVSDPEPVFGQPDSTGLIVVDCQVFRHRTGNLFDVGDVVSQMFAPRKKAHAMEGAFLVDNHKHVVEGQEFPIDWSGSEKLIIFTDLHPGDYRLAQIMVTYDWQDEESVYDEDEGWVTENVTRYSSAIINIPPDAHEALAIELSPMQSIYIGKLTILDEGGDGDNEYEIDNDPNHEIKALKYLIKKYEDSHWVPCWRKRLAELEDT